VSEPGSTDRLEVLAQRWTALRPRLTGVAYAVVGTRAEAEDVVADCWLRLASADARDPVRDLEAWGTTAVARRALDVLRSARSRREAHVGPWLPEAVVGPVCPAAEPGRGVLGAVAAGVGSGPPDPADRVHPRRPRELGAGGGAAVADASRARTHVAAAAPRARVDPQEHARVTRAFLAAAAGQDVAALLVLLDPDVVLTSDGGGRVSAALRPVHGADHVARFVVGIARKRPAGTAELVRVNGLTGFAVREHAAVVLVAVLTTAPGTGRISRVDLVLNPEELPPS